jgi:hypothetical protein
MSGASQRNRDRSGDPVSGPGACAQRYSDALVLRWSFAHATATGSIRRDRDAEEAEGEGGRVGIVGRRGPLEVPSLIEAAQRRLNFL